MIFDDRAFSSQNIKESEKSPEDEVDLSGFHWLILKITFTLWRFALKYYIHFDKINKIANRGKL